MQAERRQAHGDRSDHSCNTARDPFIAASAPRRKARSRRDAGASTSPSRKALSTGRTAGRAAGGRGATRSTVAYHDDGMGPAGRGRQPALREALPGGIPVRALVAHDPRKRENFRAAFAGFDFEKVAQFGARDVERCLADAGIVRHRGKIELVINNAKRALELVDEAGSLAAFVWRFEPDPKSRPEADRPRRPSSDLAGIDRALQGSAQARLVLRRADDGLRLHAGHGPGQRPHRGLRLPRRSGGRAARLRAAKIVGREMEQPTLIMLRSAMEPRTMLFRNDVCMSGIE